MNYILPHFGGLIIISDKFTKNGVDSHVKKGETLCRYTCGIDEKGICQYWDDVCKFPTKVDNNEGMVANQNVVPTL